MLPAEGPQPASPPAVQRPKITSDSGASVVRSDGPAASYQIPARTPTAEPASADPAAAICRLQSSAGSKTAVAFKRQQGGAVEGSPVRCGASPKLSTPGAIRPEVIDPGVQMQTPIANQLKLPTALLQGIASAECGTGQDAGKRGETAASGASLVAPSAVQPAVPTVVPLLLQQTSSVPLMQQVLQKQQHRQQEPSTSGKQQDSSRSIRSGKRQGYCIDPDALRRTLEKQLQKQRWEQEQAQLKQRQAEQQALLQQQQQQLLEVLAQQQQQMQEQQQQAMRNQKPQRLQRQQHHRQRIQPLLPQEFKQQIEQLAPGQAAVTATYGDQHPGVYADVQPAAAPSTAAVEAPTQLQQSRAPSHACMGSSITLQVLGQGPGSEHLNSSKVFGSAQKRLRLSICGDGHHTGLAPPPSEVPLSEALVSPVLPVCAAALETSGITAASKAAVWTAAATGLLEPDALPTPSAFFAPSPTAAAAAPGAVGPAATSAPGTYAIPMGAFAAASEGDLGRSRSAAVAKNAVTRSADAAAANTSPSPAFATPSKLLDVSPIAADVGISAAAAAGPGAASAAVSTAVDEAPTFITPSKFFNCSPASADKQQSRPRRETPLTPILFGHPASPWSRQTQTQQRQQHGLASTNPLREARRCNIDDGEQPSSWVPVADNGQSVQPAGPHDAAAAAAATPASGHVRVGLFRTPPTAAAIGRSGHGSECDVVLDPAAAAAVPVDIDAIARKRKLSSAAAEDSAATPPAGTEVGSSAAKPIAVAGEGGQASAQSGVVSTEVSSHDTGVVVGAPLMTPPVQEQSVAATPLTEVL